MPTDIAAATTRREAHVNGTAPSSTVDELAFISDMAVEATAPASGVITAVTTTYQITYTRRVHDTYVGDYVPEVSTAEGFADLPFDAYNHLVYVQPELVPAIIMELCPGNPGAALRTYFVWERSN
jgi:hypothetical protein